MRIRAHSDLLKYYLKRF